jgi:hypothetical protein
MPKKLASLVKLAVLGIALAAMAAASRTSPVTAESTCPPKTHLIVCPNGNSFCCPNNAFCVCGP